MTQLRYWIIRRIVYIYIIFICICSFIKINKYIYTYISLNYNSVGSLMPPTPFWKAQVLQVMRCKCKLLDVNIIGSQYGRAKRGLNRNILREFVLNSRHPGPRREKWGWERRPLRLFGRIRGIRGIRGWIPRGYFLCAGIVKWTHLLGIGRPIFDKSEKIGLGNPRHPQGTPRGFKMPSNATWSRQHVPKCRQMRHGFDNMFQNAVKCDMVSTTSSKML